MGGSIGVIVYVVIVIVVFAALLGLVSRANRWPHERHRDRGLSSRRPSPDADDFVKVASTANWTESQIWLRFLTERGIDARVEVESLPDVPSELSETVIAIAAPPPPWITSKKMEWGARDRDFVSLLVPYRDAERTVAVLHTSRLIGVGSPLFYK